MTQLKDLQLSSEIIDEDFIQQELSVKVDKKDGYNLSQNDFSNEYLNKLNTIEMSADRTIVDDFIDYNSSNPIKNSSISIKSRELYYDIMTAKESVNQLSYRVNQLEDLTQPEIPVCDYTISSAAELCAFALSVQNGYNYKGEKVCLIRNIDLAEYDNFPMIGQGFKNDSSFLSAFCGTFDGCNHTILNYKTRYTQEMKENDPYPTGVGFFRTFRGFGKIQNLHLANAQIINETGSGRTGGLIGRGYNARMENCSFSGVVQGGVQFGGLIGQMMYGDINNCTFTGTIKSNSNRVIGGIVGQGAEDQGKILNCKANGIMYVNSENNKVIGVANIIGSINDYGFNIKNNYCNMLIVDQNNTVINYLPIVGAVPQTMTENDYNSLKTKVVGNILDKEIFTESEYYYYDANGNNTGYVI